MTDHGIGSCRNHRLSPLCLHPDRGFRKGVNPSCPGGQPKAKEQQHISARREPPRDCRPLETLIVHSRKRKNREHHWEQDAEEHFIPAFCPWVDKMATRRQECWVGAFQIHQRSHLHRPADQEKPPPAPPCKRSCWEKQKHDTEQRNTQHDADEPASIERSWFIVLPLSHAYLITHRLASTH